MLGVGLNRVSLRLWTLVGVTFKDLLHGLTSAYLRVLAARY